MGRIATVDFFTVLRSIQAGSTFRGALDRAMTLPEQGRARTRGSISGDPLRLQELYRLGNSSRFEGDLVRIRMTDVPPVVSTDGDLQPIDLEDNEGIGERSAWWADAARNVIGIQRSKFVSPKSFGSYFTSLAEDDQVFELVPIIHSDAMRRFLGFGEIRSLRIRVASPDPASLRDIGATPRAMVDIMRDLQAPEIEINPTMGHRRGALSTASAKRLVRSLFGTNSVRKLEVRGRVEDEDPIEEFDVLDYRLRSRIEIESEDERTIPYSARRDAVRQAVDEQREELATVRA